jgi:hypothetical protein
MNAWKHRAEWRLHDAHTAVMAMRTSINGALCDFRTSRARSLGIGRRTADPTSIGFGAKSPNEKRPEHVRPF